MFLGEQRKDYDAVATQAFMLEHCSECMESVTATAAVLGCPHAATFPQSTECIADRMAANLNRAGHFDTLRAAPASCASRCRAEQLGPSCGNVADQSSSGY